MNTKLIKNLRAVFRKSFVSKNTNIPTLIDTSGGTSLDSNTPKEPIKADIYIRYHHIAERYEGLTVTTELIEDARVFAQSEIKLAHDYMSKCITEKAYRILLARMAKCKADHEPFSTEEYFDVSVEDIQNIKERRQLKRRATDSSILES